MDCLRGTEFAPTSDWRIKMARSHKYIKRTGSPGNYRYWYYDPSAPGHLREGNESEQAAGKFDHARRLLAGRDAGHHSMSVPEMASEVGYTATKLREHLTNMQSNGIRRVPGTERSQALKHGHDYKEHHMKEAHHSPEHPDYQRHVQTHIDTHRLGSAAAPAPEAPARPRRARAASAASRVREHDRAERAADSAHMAAAARPSRAPTVPEARAAFAEAAARPSPAPSASDRAAAKIKELRDKLAAAGGPNFHEHEAAARSASTPAPAAPAPRPATPLGMPQTPSERDRARETVRQQHDKIDEKMQQLLHGHQIPIMEMNPLSDRAKAILSGGGYSPEAAAGKAFDEFKAAGKITASETPAAASARRARNAAASPAAPAAAVVAEHAPGFAESEEPIRRMVETQARGGNPYLDRAKEIFDRIKSDVKEERRDKAEHLLQAITQARSGTFTEASVLEKYKALHPGARVIPKEDFEKATFMTFDEVMGNKPIDIEVERMKRGYAAKVFSRMQPYLNDAFKMAHPEAPPPYPTYDDLKTWGQHGERAAHAQTTQKAHPKEFSDSMPKGPDGKPMMPPGWMPLHLAPVWNYINKEHAGKMTRDGKPLVYAHTRMTAAEASQRGGSRMVPNGDGKQKQVVALPNQWRDDTESVFESSLRKYVQMRGGAEQLVDIPHSKLAEIGISHADIFKSDSDKLFHTLKTKVIDPVALMGFMMKGKTKKSFDLVIGADLGPVDFKKSATHTDKAADLRKSKIEQIKGLLRKRQG